LRQYAGEFALTLLVFRSCSRIALCLIARFARCDVRWVAAVFVGSVGTKKRCSAISSCTQLAAGAGARYARAICWEIGGANIENPPPSSSLTEERSA
jgi:hypothetical protein